MTSSTDLKKNDVEQSTKRILRWSVLGLFFILCAIISVNVNDSTILKPILLYVLLPAIFCYLLYTILSTKKTALIYSLMNILIAGYLLTGILSLTHAVNWRLSAETLAQQACYGILFSIVFDIFSTMDSVLQAVKFSMILTALVCVVGMIEAVSPSIFSIMFLSNQEQFISTFGNSTYFAGFLVLMLPLCLALIITTQQKKITRIPYILLFIVIIYMLVMTESRSAWLAAILSLLAFGMINYTSVKTRWFVIAGTIFFLIAIYVIFPDLIAHRLETAFSGNQSSSLQRRIFFYKGALKAFASSPITGNGIGNFSLFLPKFRSPEYWMVKSEDVVPHAHNEYLEVLSETGIAGIAFFLTILAVYFHSMWKAIRNNTGANRTMLIALTCGIAAVLIDNLGSLNLRTIPVATGFWMLMAMSLRIGGIRTHTITFQPGGPIRNFQLLPFLIYGIFLFRLFPFIISRYSGDARFLDGFRSDFNGDHAVAEESFRAAVADDPYFAQARFYLASSLMKEKNSREAIAQSSELLQQYPYYPKIKLIKAIAEFDLGDTTAAFRDIADEMTMETEPLTLYYASFFHYKMNDPAGEYRYVSALAQNSIKSRNNEYMPQAIERLSIIGLSMHDTVTCSEMFPRIRNAFPDDGEILAALCEGYGRLGNYNDARSTLALALSLAPTDDAVKKRLDQIRRQLASMP